MRTYICREDLREDLIGYAVCAGNPTWLARHKATEVIDNIPEAVVRCKNCEHGEACKFDLGEEGFCSRGARKKA